MQRHKFIRRVLVVVLCTAIGLGLGLWKAGLAPVWAGLVSLNAIALTLYGFDKRQAIAGGVRIPEIVLHLVALFGGSPGALVGQQLFRHKTCKRSFRLVTAAILLLQAGVIYGYWRWTRG
ncbi:MAG TPA: DUF1294 domain-containing protein [Sedimentisphaerales bacterium]|nr:DUF1294 domain-containing protein [Sedimentisphaerales bacterium]